MTDEQLTQWATEAKLADMGLNPENVFVQNMVRRLAKLVRNAALDEAKANLLDAGYKSTGIPAYESLAERLERLKS